MGIVYQVPDETEQRRPRVQDRRNIVVISMHCPSCGAEGRIPKEKLDTRLVCKKCLKTFHLTPEGRPLPGPPPHDEDEDLVSHRHDAPGHEFDHVDEEIDLVMRKIRETLPKVGIGLGILVALYFLWPLLRGSRPVGLKEQAKAAALALAHGDSSALRSVSVASSPARELFEALRPEFQGRGDIEKSSEPMVDVERKSEAPGPGLAEVLASIRPEDKVTRSGIGVRDTSTDVQLAKPVQFPLVLSGDDRSGWWVDGARSLEAYRKMKAPAEPPPAAPEKPAGGKSTKAAATVRRSSSATSPRPTTTARPAGAPRA